MLEAELAHLFECGGESSRVEGCERALLAGGGLRVLSEPGGGTTVELTVGGTRPSVAPPLPPRHPLVQTPAP